MRMPSIIRLAIVIFVVLVFIVYLFLNSENFRPLLDANYYLLAVAALAYMGGVFANGIFIKFILEPFNKFIAAGEAFYVSVISSIGNFFAPGGTGFVVRAVYLKKKHGLAYSEFISTLSGNYVLVFLVSSFVGLTSLLALKQYYSFQWLVLFVFFCLLFLVSLLISLFKPKLPELDDRQDSRSRRLSRNVCRVVNGWSKIVSDKKLMLRLLSLTFVNLALAVII